MCCSISAPRSSFRKRRLVASGNATRPKLSFQALAHAPWLAFVDPGPIAAVASAFGLGSRETAVLAQTLTNPGSGTILYDQAARHAAATLWHPSSGNPGPRHACQTKRVEFVGTACPETAATRGNAPVGSTDWQHQQALFKNSEPMPNCAPERVSARCFSASKTSGMGCSS